MPIENLKIILIEKKNVILTSNEVVENEKLIVKNDEITKIFNKYFSGTVDKLIIFEWPSCESEYTEDQLTNIINKYKSHPSIKKIKSNYTIKQKFSFKPVTVKDIENVIKNIPTNKVTGGEIPLNVLKQSGYTYVILRECINDFLGSFPDSLKLGNITPVHKKDEPTDKENYRPVRILPLLLKIFERLIYDQLNEYLEQYLNSLLSGFREAHCTQHALFRLLQEWQNELDKSGFVGTILMDLSNAYHCLPHDLLIEKLWHR